MCDYAVSYLRNSSLSNMPKMNCELTVETRAQIIVIECYSLRKIYEHFKISVGILHLDMERKLKCYKKTK